MKVFRHPLAIMYLIFIVLVVAGLIFLFNVFDLFVRDSTVVIPKPASTDYTRWELPKGAKARLGKGQIRDIKFAPDGKRFAVATTIGVWMYDAKTGAEISLLSGDRHDYNGIAFSYDGSTL
ncbi:WD40 repeat domain-containing protein, partial [Candidatus Poribacteria bacterium]|nr:WD40 repeat domain-containing protein [Candidatus Poribacteria bacterium]